MHRDIDDVLHAAVHKVTIMNLAGVVMAEVVVWFGEGGGGMQGGAHHLIRPESSKNEITTLEVLPQAKVQREV